MQYVVHTDGGARGNPGPAAIGVVVESGGTSIIRFGRFIGEATNNTAEYTAVVEALKAIKDHVSRTPEEKASLHIQFCVDSTLVVQQLNGRFKVKSPDLRRLLTEVRILEQDIGGKVTYTVVPREQNQEADALVNQSLDRQIFG